MKVEITAALCIGELYGKSEDVMVTIEQLAGITSQHNEIVKRVSNGSLDSKAVKRALQNIIEGNVPEKLNWGLPTWWRTPEQQLELARRLWPNVVLPKPLEEFEPWTESEVLLLHVPADFHTLWNQVNGPSGYTKRARQDLKIGNDTLRLVPHRTEFTEPVWVAFDPEHGRGWAPSSVRSMLSLAASEVFSALIQFHDWPRSWHSGAAAPNLAGYELKDDAGRWTRVLYFELWEEDFTLKLLGGDGRYRHDDWASPSVRLLATES